MTVCVAALSSDGASVVGASDRMVSTTDNQTRRMKIHHLTDQIVAMIAGDVALHTELLNEIRAAIAINADTPENISVKSIADTYASAFWEAKRRRAEQQFLAPLGLNTGTFLEQQRSLNDKIVADITREIVGFQMPSCSALIIGKDASLGYVRAHIYAMESGVITCHNETGFASIGVGWYQAMSSLMFAGHRAELTLDSVLYMTLAAKKRAEVAPGVGQETDMVAITVPDENYVLSASTMERMESIYARSEGHHDAINQNAIRECHEFFDTFRNPPAKPDVEERVELSGTQPQPNDVDQSGSVAEAQARTDPASV